MAERVRIMHYEADDVHRMVQDYLKYTWRAGPDARAEDLVNAIGEVYETALARRDARVNEKLAEVAEAEA